MILLGEILASNAFRLVIGQYLNHEGLVISHLNISSVHTSDGGLYKCRASNTIGKVEHRARLNVYGRLTMALLDKTT